MDRRTQKWALGAIVVVYLGLGLSYSIVNPILESPDEVLNYENILFLASERRLPILEEDELSKAHHPPLYYAIGALLIGRVPSDRLQTLVEQTNPFWAYRLWEPGVDNKNLYLHNPAVEGWPYRDVALAVHLMRCLSLLMGVGVIWIVFRLADELFADEPTAGVAAAALVAFNPMFLYIQSSVHNDALTNLWAAAALWGAGRYWLRGPSLRRAAFLGVVCSLGALTKITFLFLGSAVALAVAWRNWLDRRTSPHWRRDIGRSVLVVGGLMVALSGWWFVRNQLIYGDPTSMGAQAATWGIRENAPDVTAAVRELGFLLDSFWGVFGYGQIPLPPWVYALLRTLMLAAAGGLVIWLVRSWRSNWHYRVPAALLAALAAAPLTAFGATFARMTVSATADFGRYLFTAYAVIAPALLLGITEWLPERHRSAVLVPLSSALLLLAAGALVGVLAPAYSPPPIHTNADEVEITHPLEVEYPGLARLLGYDVAPGSAVPGERLDVTLYWQVTGTTEKNYVEFVQLVRADGTRIAGRDTHAGLGRYPTSRWEPGQIIVDTVPLHIDPDAVGPDGLRLDMGLHDEEGRLMTEEGHNTISAGEIRLAALEQPAAVGDPLEYDLGEYVELIAAQPGPPAVLPGSTVPFTLTWRCVQQPDGDYMVLVHVLSEGGDIITQGDGPPLAGSFPTRLWEPGDVVIDGRRLQLPKDVPPGAYTVVVGWYRLDTMERLPVRDEANRPVPNAAIRLFTFHVPP